MNDRFTEFWRKLYRDPFKRYLVIALSVLGTVIMLASPQAAEPISPGGYQVHYFYLPGCSHCEAQKPFNEELAASHPSISLIYHDVTKPKESALLTQMAADSGVDDDTLEFPITIFGGLIFDGWDSAETTGAEIEESLQHCLSGDCREPETQQPRDTVNLPIVGEIQPADYSLNSLAVTLGLVDGFNPCAMWVLAYLISLIATLRNKRRAWLVVGAFIFASGVLYFLFMTAWLNAFLLIGYFRPVTIGIGLLALGGGIINIREYIKTKGALVCEVAGEGTKKKTMSRMEKILSSPLTLATVAGIIALAFVVNSIEFACSAAIPAVFTHILSLKDLTSFQYYRYIALYVFFFMLDDAIIFGSAAFAINSRWGERCAKYSRPVGGTLLIVLGAIILFAQNLLF